MNARMLVAVFAVMAGLVLLAHVPGARAGIDPVLVVDDLFAALNAGDVDMALAAFDGEVTARNLVRDETYSGPAEVRQMLLDMQQEGREFEIVKVRMSGDTITAEVEVSDGGYIWGTELIEAVVKDGKLKSFTVVAFHLELWRIGR